jgi:hypothetical protein
MCKRLSLGVTESVYVCKGDKKFGLEFKRIFFSPFLRISRREKKLLRKIAARERRWLKSVVVVLRVAK